MKVSIFILQTRIEIFQGNTIYCMLSICIEVDIDSKSYKWSILFSLLDPVSANMYV